jgi:hypothetical protein
MLMKSSDDHLTMKGREMVPDVEGQGCREISRHFPKGDVSVKVTIKFSGKRRPVQQSAE